MCFLCESDLHARQILTFNNNNSITASIALTNQHAHSCGYHDNSRADHALRDTSERRASIIAPPCAASLAPFPHNHEKRVPVSRDAHQYTTLTR